MVALLTVPQAARHCDVGVDRLRKVLKKRSEVAALFKMVGPLRVLPIGKVQALRTLLSEGGRKLAKE